MLEDETGVLFERVIVSCSDIPVVYKRIYPVLESQPGCWIGKQIFSLIPDHAIPYLILASIFHIGAHTHFGCGTFLVD